MSEKINVADYTVVRNNITKQNYILEKNTQSFKV